MPAVLPSTDSAYVALCWRLVACAYGVGTYLCQVQVHTLGRCLNYGVMTFVVSGRMPWDAIAEDDGEGANGGSTLWSMIVAVQPATRLT